MKDRNVLAPLFCYHPLQSIFPIFFLLTDVKAVTMDSIEVKASLTLASADFTKGLSCSPFHRPLFQSF